MDINFLAVKPDAQPTAKFAGLRRSSESLSRQFCRDEGLDGDAQAEGRWYGSDAMLAAGPAVSTGKEALVLTLERLIFTELGGECRQKVAGHGPPYSPHSSSCARQSAATSTNDFAGMVFSSFPTSRRK